MSTPERGLAPVSADGITDGAEVGDFVVEGFIAEAAWAASTSPASAAWTGRWR